MKRKQKLRLPRSTVALDAKTRRAGPMKHRTEPRGGAQNEERDLLSQVDEEEERSKTFEVRFEDDVGHWILFEDSKKTDSWIMGLTSSASDELIRYAIAEQFMTHPDDKFIIVRN